MSEIALWLIYGLSGVIAFLIIHFRGWQIVPAMLAGAAAALVIYLAVSIARGADLGDPLLGQELLIVGSFALVAAFLGAALAFAAARRPKDR